MRKATVCKLIKYQRENKPPANMLQDAKNTKLISKSDEHKHTVQKKKMQYLFSAKKQTLAKQLLLDELL